MQNQKHYEPYYLHKYTVLLSLSLTHTLYSYTHTHCIVTHCIVIHTHARTHARTHACTHTYINSRAWAHTGISELIKPEIDVHLQYPFWWPKLFWPGLWRVTRVWTCSESLIHPRPLYNFYISCPVPEVDPNDGLFLFIFVDFLNLFFHFFIISNFHHYQLSSILFSKNLREL